jgi:hypothetical protein
LATRRNDGTDQKNAGKILENPGRIESGEMKGKRIEI